MTRRYPPNPTSLHYDTLCALRGKAGALFIEKPIFDAPGKDLGACLRRARRHMWRRPCAGARRNVGLKAPSAAASAVFGAGDMPSYLPEWRPGVDYCTVYSAIQGHGRRCGRGPHPRMGLYGRSLFGTPRQVYCLKGTLQRAGLDSDDLAVYIARYDTLLAEVHLDYFGRTYRRSIELFCKDGTVTADFGAGTLTLADGRVETYPEPVNARCEREMEYFLEYALHGTGGSVEPPRTAQGSLKIALGKRKGMEHVLITICGRAGSKGFKNKNLKILTACRSAITAWLQQTV